MGINLKTQIDKVGEIDHGAKRLFYQKLSAIRGISAVIIVLYHSLAHSRTWKDVDFNSIDQILRSSGLVIVFFFLILSGFINFRPYASSIITGESPAVKGFGFFIRRISKLLPIYWISLVIWFIPASILNLENKGWRMFFFLHIFEAKDNPEFIMGIITSWALAIEFFYLIPLTLLSIYLGYKNVKLRDKTIYLYSIIAIIAVVVSNILRYSHIKANPSSFKQWWPVEQWDKFIFGELIALAIVFLITRKKAEDKVKKAAIISRYSLFTLGTALLLLFPIDDWFFTEKSSNYIFLSNFTALPLALWMMVEGIFFTKGKWFRKKSLQKLGELSFPIFIFHPVMLDFIRMYYVKKYWYYQVFDNWGATFLTTILFTLLFSLILDKLFISKVNNFIKKYDTQVKVSNKE